MRTWVSLMLGVGLCVACGPVAPGPEGARTPDDLTPPAPVPPSPSVPQEEPGDRPSGTDAGTPVVDAGTPVVDAGTPVVDAGTPVVDAGTPVVDAGEGAPRGAWLRSSFHAGVSPEGLAVGDFDEDGAPDVAINAGGRNYSSEYVAREGEFLLLRNDGAGHLTRLGERFPLKSTGRIVAGDVDGDGHLDVLLGTRYGLHTLWGRGDGSWATRASSPSAGGVIASMGLWPTASGPSALWVLGNSDGDGPPGGLAAFSLVLPSGTGTWRHVRMALSDGATPLVFLTDLGRSAVVADFNEDGLPDVAMNMSGGMRWDANILLGTDWGAVRPAGFFPRTRSLLRVYAADFNRDGHVDVLGLGGSSLEVYLGDGHGSFAGGDTRGFSAPAGDAAVVDFDGDGVQDVVTLHPSTAEVSLFRGRGDGTLVPHGRLAVGRRPSAAAVADLDRDGTVELLVAEADDNTVSVYSVPPVAEFGPFAPAACPLGAEAGATSAGGAVSPLASLEVGPVAASPFFSPVWGPTRSPHAVGDFDGDGRRDLAFAHQGGVRLVLHPVEGTFLLRDIPGTQGVLGLTAGDLDGDGRTELVVSSQLSQWSWKTSILWNDADGLFREEALFGEGHDALAADFNGDGRVDLAVSGAWGCSGPVLRFTNLGQRTFRQDGLADYNPEPDDSCPGVSAVLAGDYDGDGTLDLLHTSLGINLNPTARDGTSLPGHGFALGGHLGRSSWSVDADADGRMDLLVRTYRPDNGVLFFQGDGYGSLRAPATCVLPSAGRLFLWEDVNGDGLADAVGEAQDGQGLWVGLGTGGGKWRPRLYALGGPVEWARAADLVGDARPELVVLMRSGELRVYPMP